MLDPLSAISLASAIVQLVDFSSKLLIEGYGVYKSETGATEESQEVQRATERLHELANRLSGPRKVWKTSEELALWELAAEAQQVSEQLLDLLAECKISSAGLVRTWDAVRKTIRRHVKAEKYANLQNRLDRIQRDISVQLLAILRDDQSAVRQSLKNIVVTSEKLHAQQTNRIENRTRELRTVLERQGNSMQALLSSNKSSSEAQAAAAQRFEASLQNLDAKLTALQQEGAAVTTSKRILDSLVFAEMHQRKRDIHKQYPDTFSWMFDEVCTPFKTWLSSGSGIFWVSGKAGSGKSTLMKYVTDSDQGTHTLHQWARSKQKDLVIGSFYFWNAGSDMQNSQEGLLQSLVYQTFLQCPDMIKQAATKKRWHAPDSYHTSHRPWEIDELCETVENIARHSKMLSKCFCFFVDGLDEYSGDNFTTLIDLFDKLTVSDSVKMCVSSRPWTVFEAAYGDDKSKRLALQDLTVGDMDKYINGMLEKNREFQKLAQRTPGAWLLARTIRERAEGVFLWVYLVVRRLLRLLEERLKDLNLLQAALDELPSDLDKYFKHIIDTIELAHRMHTAGIFSLALYAAPLPLIAFWFLPTVLKTPDAVYSLPVGCADEDDADDGNLVGRTKEAINSWCKDLLEVRSTTDAAHIMNERDYQIDFLHRTVRDFLTMNGEVRRIFADNLAPDFNAGHTLTRLYLVQAMTGHPRSTDSKDVRAFAIAVLDVMMIARRSEIAKTPVNPRMLDHLDCVGGEMMLPSEELGHWLHLCPQLLCAVHSDYNVGEGQFLGLAVACELTSYVHCQLNKSPSIIDGRSGAILLDIAFHRLVTHRTLATDRLPCYDMVMLLLGKGADPNMPLSNSTKASTPWHHFLKRCHTSSSSSDSGMWPHAKLLLKFGADPYAEVPGATKVVQRIRKNARHTVLRPSFTAEQCLLRVCSGNLLPELYACLEEAREQKAQKILERKAAEQTQGTLFVNALWKALSSNPVSSWKARG
ncbi:hypothetical protein LTR86_002966 [Recurvomyces mirabilis]|nr:hypothetical protein LTR86_002966 [Recurvomyces mirabilis]